MEPKIKAYVTQILCALCAIALWLFVSYTEDPQTELWVRNIPISYMGANELADRGLAFVYTEEKETVNVKLSGRKSVLRRLDTAAIDARVNYGSIESVGDHMLPIHVSLPENDLRIKKLSENAIPCKTDTLVTVDKTVRITASGAEPLGIRDFAAYPPTVKLSGPKSALSGLTAGVFVDLTGGDAADSYTVTLSDDTGAAYEGSAVSIETSQVTVSATRSLPVKINAANLPPEKKLAEVVCDPASVDVRGELAALMGAESVDGAYDVWLRFAPSPANSGPVQLLYPKDVQALGPAYASATFYFENE